MLITNSVAFLINEKMAYDYKKLVKPKNSKFHFKARKFESKPKKHKQLNQNKFFVLWAPSDCKSGLPLTEYRYENCLIDPKKTKKI